MNNINKYLDRVERYLADLQTIIYTDSGNGSAGDGYLTWDIWESLIDNYTPIIRSIKDFEKEFDTKIKDFYRIYDYLDTRDIECFIEFIYDDDYTNNSYRVYVPVYNY